MARTDYLVSCGLAGDVAPYRAGHPLALPRGERVVVRGLRGLELGEILRPASEQHIRHFGKPGELLRPAGEEDLASARAAVRRAWALLERGGAVARGLGMPVELLDAEVLLGGEDATLVCLRWGECDLRDLVRPLSSEFGLSLTLSGLTAPSAGGCGEGGCGSCGSG